MKATLGGIALAIAFIAFGALGGFRGGSDDFGYRQWTARELARLGTQAVECSSHELVNLEHSMSDFDCRCYCPPDGHLGKIIWSVDKSMANCSC